MAWRGSTSVPDRILSCLPYAFPMVEASVYGIALISMFPFLGVVLLPLIPFASVYGLVNNLLGGWGGFAIFFALYLLVVRNTNVNHFIRYHTMQALMIGIAVSLISAILQLLGMFQTLGAPLPLPLVFLFSLIFLAVMASSLYAIVNAIIGKYGEIPVLSEAAYAQTRY